MAGSRLEAKVHLVTCSENSSQNIHKCINASGLDVEAFVLEQLASSYSVLTEDERNLGVCLIDIGGGTTGYSCLCRWIDMFYRCNPYCRRSCYT